MPPKRPASPSPPPSSYSASTPIHDRASTFKAHYSPTLPSRTLQSFPGFRAATHRITAWRIPSKQKTLFQQQQQQPHRQLYDTGFDDDGESHAGKRLLRVLEACNVQGAVVVARWYGGVMLGPVRFEHIENCARDAIRAWQRDHGGATAATAVGTNSNNDNDSSSKRLKVGQNGNEEADQATLEKRRQRLVALLRERDGSIDVLRGLLKQKMDEAEAEAKADADADAETSTTNDKAETILDVSKDITQPITSTTAAPAPAPAPASVTPKKQIDYTKMPLAALQKLEHARDATITWILGQIDKAEREAKQRPTKGSGIAAGTGTSTSTAADTIVAGAGDQAKQKGEENEKDEEEKRTLDEEDDEEK